MYTKEALLCLVDKFTNFKTLSFLNELKKTQALPLSQIESIQWGRLKELLEFVYEKSEFYRNMFRQNKLVPRDIKCKEDLEMLPVITKEQIRKYKSGIISSKKDFFIKSADTTGNYPMETFLDFECASKKYAVYLRHLLRCGWDFDTKIIHFLPAVYKNKIIDYKNGIKQFFSTFIQNKISHDFLTRREVIFYDDLSPIISKKKLEYYYRKINSHKKFIIMGRADFFNILVYNFKKVNFKVIKPKAIINIGGLLPEVLKKRIALFFSCPIYNIYGSSELSYIAGNCRINEALHINEETHYVEIVKNEQKYSGSNKWGKIIVTDLLNYSMPLIRYAVGDIGHIKQGNCEYCGLRLLNVGGREENYIQCDDKRLLTEKEICNAVFSDKNVLQFHLKFVKNSESELQIIKTDTGINERLLLEKLDNIGLEKIKIKYVERFTAHYRNKLQYVSRI